MRKAVINLLCWSPSGLTGGAAAIPEAQVNHLCGPNTMAIEHTVFSLGTSLNVFVKVLTSPQFAAEICSQVQVKTQKYNRDHTGTASCLFDVILV